ncbi:MAG TPA: hypothetical protein VJV23_10220 [Candidatus Polarisedimenticolia bacterium]|nr:hypothetical protein [Candidatus Polarisedimenticolia bacterium]
MKTAYEIAMEKLRRRDAERGEAGTSLDDRQKEEIAGIRRVAQARLAEREILHQGELRKARATRDPEAVTSLEEGYRRDRARIEEEMESKIRAVRERRGRR